MTHINEINDIYILSFGYGNRKDYNDLLKYLKLFRVRCIVDVRMSPRAWSRKWYGKEIEKLCTQQNIKYISKVCLGNISGKNNWISPSKEEAYSTLVEISKIAESETILLLCAEMDSSRCHRVDVAHELQKLVDNPIKHLK